MHKSCMIQVTQLSCFGGSVGRVPDYITLDCEVQIPFKAAQCVLFNSLFCFGCIALFLSSHVYTTTARVHERGVVLLL